MTRDSIPTKPRSHPHETAKIRRLVPALLRWFAIEARDLPWRRTDDPYGIWVSEIMLQQTQVKTVIPYWTRWMRALPTATRLGNATEPTVLKLWEGLGYYSRARNMQKAARIIAQQHQGKFPREFDDILALPGVGRYTAGAIASIAYNQRAPLLDGNVIRVLTRLFAIRADPREAPTNLRLWSLARALVETAGKLEDSERQPLAPKPPFPAAGYCSLLNQSLMELGALRCTPKRPGCIGCPVRLQCDAYREGQVDSLPNLAPRQATTQRRFIAVAVRKGTRWLVRKRPSDGLNGGLWEFPNTELKRGVPRRSSLKQCLPDNESYELTPLKTVRHSITRYRITLEGFRAESGTAKIPNNPRSKRTPKARARLGDGLSTRWLSLKQLQGLAFTAAHRKLLEALLEAT